jgi:putative MATE family efflux protein
MWIVLAANLLSALLCPLLVYPLGLGLAGSAIANAVAQTLGGLLFVRALVIERVSLRPHPASLRRQLVVGRDLFVRGAAFQACFLSAAAVCARFGAPVLAAHQIALQLWMFCALALDAIAIAAQSLVGAALGAGDLAGARRTANRITLMGGFYGLAFGVLIAAGAFVLPSVFSADPVVREQALIAWPWFVAMQPLGGIVFALDGVLIGASDARFMRNLTLVAALGFFLPAIWLAYGFNLGIGGVWAGLTLFIVARLVGLLTRLRGGKWAVAGAVR